MEPWETVGRAVFKITEGQYALGGLTVLAVWLFVILPCCIISAMGG
jgi:hypothetical protein